MYNLYYDTIKGAEGTEYKFVANITNSKKQTIKDALLELY